jgi:prephenate dehydrogenase
MKKTVAIVGLGLIGGSIALGIRGKHPDVDILCYDISEEALKIGLKRNVLTKAFSDLSLAVKEADVIFLALPVKQTIILLKELAALPLKKNVLITDVGSTKQEVLTCANELWQRGKVRFLGGHPMAGSHKSGVLFADEHLFENAYYILTPSKKLTDDKAIEELSELLSGLHAKIQVMEAADHNLVTSQISHFPHVLAAALVNQSNEYNQNHPFTKVLAAGGFKDMTRIADSDETMWTDILLSNGEVVIERVDNFIEHLQVIKKSIATKNRKNVLQFFKQAKDFRNQMSIHKKGGLCSFYDLFVNIPDYPGVIHEITGILKHEKISLVNIGILETRVELDGTLQLSFKTQEDLVKAKAAIEKATDYKTMVNEER